MNRCEHGYINVENYFLFTQSLSTSPFCFLVKAGAKVVFCARGGKFLVHFVC